MRFFINGEDLGLAFSNLELVDKDENGESCGLRPAASLNTGQKGRKAYFLYDIGAHRQHFRTKRRCC